MKTRIFNARILTMEEGRGIFQGEIGIEDGRIRYVREEDAGQEAGESSKAEDWEEEMWKRPADGRTALIPEPERRL